MILNLIVPRVSERSPSAAVNNIPHFGISTKMNPAVEFTQPSPMQV